MSDKPKWYTVTEIAKDLRISRMAVYRMLESGRMPGGKRLGPKLIRVKADVYHAWLETLPNTTEKEPDA